MDVVKEGNCIRCGYDLTGLPRAGHCPECGNEYDDHTRAGFGSSSAERQMRMDRRMARARTVCFGGLALLPLVMALAISLAGWGKPTRAFAIAVFFSLFFALATVVSYVYERPE